MKYLDDSHAQRFAGSLGREVPYAHNKFWAQKLDDFMQIFITDREELCAFVSGELVGSEISSFSDEQQRAVIQNDMLSEK